MTDYNEYTKEELISRIEELEESYKELTSEHEQEIKDLNLGHNKEIEKVEDELKEAEDVRDEYSNRLDLYDQLKLTDDQLNNSFYIEAIGKFVREVCNNDELLLQCVGQKGRENKIYISNTSAETDFINRIENTLDISTNVSISLKDELDKTKTALDNANTSLEQVTDERNILQLSYDAILDEKNCLEVNYTSCLKVNDELNEIINEKQALIDNLAIENVKLTMNISNSSNNFFSRISDIVSGFDLNITIRNNINSLHILLRPQSIQQGNKTALSSMSINATAEELDNTFFDIITEPMKQASDIITRIDKYVKVINAGNKEEKKVITDRPAVDIFTDGEENRNPQANYEMIKSISEEVILTKAPGDEYSPVYKSPKDEQGSSEQPLF